MRQDILVSSHVLFLAMKLDLPNPTAERLQKLFGSKIYDFLGYTINLETGEIKDNLECAASNTKRVTEELAILLSHYSSSSTLPTLAGKLVKFRELPGGDAYEGAFLERAVNPVAEVFGSKPEELTRAAEEIGGKPMQLGDVSVQIQALKGIRQRNHTL